MCDKNVYLGKHIVIGIPSTAYYISEFISSDEEENILQNIYSAPKPKWTQLSNRRLQNWGGVPHSKGMLAENIPIWLTEYLERINNLNIMGGVKTNHVLVNEYLPGQGIMPHLDGFLFYPTITTISVGSHTVLKFFKSDQNEEKMCLTPVFSLLLEPRSLLVLQDELFSSYLHGIEELQEDCIDNVANLHMCAESYVKRKCVMRNTRVSLTIRHVPKTSSFKINLAR